MPTAVELGSLLADLFETEDLKRFVEATFGRGVRSEIEWIGSGSIQAWKAAGALERRGLVGPELAAALIRVLPGQADAIRRCFGLPQAQSGLASAAVAQQLPAAEPNRDGSLGHAAVEEATTPPASGPGTPPMDRDLGAIHDAVASGHLVVVAGAGVAAWTTTTGNPPRPAPTALWRGLLESGVQQAKRIGNIDDSTAALLRMNLGHPDGSMLVPAASRIADALGGSCHGAFAAWLQHSIGALQPHRPALIEALGGLACPIATTNYDGLVERVLSRRELLWTEVNKVDRWLRRDDPGVLHLHGHWEHPRSVVLGTLDYHAVASDSYASAVLRSLWMDRTLLFVGCGGTLADPNLGALIRWAASTFRGVARTHKLLLRTDEALPVDPQLLRDARVDVIRYGSEHNDLLRYLQRCAPRAGGSGVGGKEGD